MNAARQRRAGRILFVVLLAALLAAPWVPVSGQDAPPSEAEYDANISGSLEVAFFVFAAAQDALQAEYAVVASVEEFADALAGSVLGQRGPIVLTRTAGLEDLHRQVLPDILPEGGTVYVLGGAQAVSEGVVQDLGEQGYVVERLAGPTRFETSVAIASKARQLFGDNGEVALARAFGPDSDPTAAWADSITAGGWAAESGTPILITPSDEPHPAVQQFLDADAPSTTRLLGGTAALSAGYDELAGAERTAGSNRFDTGRQVALQLWQQAETGARGYAVFDATAPLGWAAGLAAAPYAAWQDSPLVASDSDGNPPEALAMVQGCDEQVRLLRAGIGEAAFEELDRQDEQPC